MDVAYDNEISAGQLVSISYRFIEELWDEENDSLCLVLDQALSETDHGSLFHFQYEVFEYINKPDCIAVGSVTGTIRMKLPSFGGLFRVVYVRRWATDSSHRSFQYYILGLSKPLSVIAPIQLGSVDPTPSSRCLHRRGAKPIVHYQRLIELLEDNRNISTLNLTLSLPPANNIDGSAQINRFMVWISSAPKNTVQLTIEMDIVSSTRTNYNTETIYATYLLPHYTVACDEPPSDINAGILLVDKSWAAIDNNGKLLCRGPYSFNVTKNDKFETSSKFAPMDNVSKRFGKLDITCKFCSTSLLNSLSTIETFLPLPSGSLDHVSSLQTLAMVLVLLKCYVISDDARVLLL